MGVLKCGEFNSDTWDSIQVNNTGSNSMRNLLENYSFKEEQSLVAQEEASMQIKL